MDFDFPWQQLTGEPIVYVSMGTLQNGLIDVFRSIAQAAVGLKRLQFVLAVGGQLDPKQLGAVPANVVVVSHAPQIKILRRSSLCITHAGSVTRALAIEFAKDGIRFNAIAPGCREYANAQATGSRLSEATKSNEAAGGGR